MGCRSIFLKKVSCTVGAWCESPEGNPYSWGLVWIPAGIPHSWGWCKFLAGIIYSLSMVWIPGRYPLQLGHGVNSWQVSFTVGAWCESPAGIHYSWDMVWISGRYSPAKSLVYLGIMSLEDSQHWIPIFMVAGQEYEICSIQRTDKFSTVVSDRLELSIYVRCSLYILCQFGSS